MIFTSLRDVAVHKFPDPVVLEDIHATALALVLRCEKRAFLWRPSLMRSVVMTRGSMLGSTLNLLGAITFDDIIGHQILSFTVFNADNLSPYGAFH